ncbi:hypothetical protein ACE6ED_13505 [Paenibacillus sp. CN-4]|uniref:hypothetical protein n=1 Tax=Paenibacillus nanchangensis TaxID=3348343 RepID=UPI003978ACBF
MLNDTPRKLLMILTHFSGHYRRMPQLHELERLSGRAPGKIYEGLRELAADHYIEWTPGRPVESAIILEGWPRPDPAVERLRRRRPPSPWDNSGSNIDYWTSY